MALYAHVTRLEGVLHISLSSISPEDYADERDVVHGSDTEVIVASTLIDDQMAGRLEALLGLDELTGDTHVLETLEKFAKLVLHKFGGSFHGDKGTRGYRGSW